jgi:hypothetical protein
LTAAGHHLARALDQGFKEPQIRLRRARQQRPELIGCDQIPAERQLRRRLAHPAGVPAPRSAQQAELLTEVGPAGAGFHHRQHVQVTAEWVEPDLVAFPWSSGRL